MGRNKLGWLIDVLFDQQHVALLGFDIVFAEPDDSSGFSRFSEPARTKFKDQAAFSERLEQLQPELDYYSLFAKLLVTRPVVLGYCFTSENDVRAIGTLPDPAKSKNDLKGRDVEASSWTGYVANIDILTLPPKNVLLS